MLEDKVKCFFPENNVDSLLTVTVAMAGAETSGRQFA